VQLLETAVERGVPVAIVTDQTSAHDPLHGYVPVDLGLDQAAALRTSNPEDYVRRARATMVRHVEAILALSARGAIAFDYGNNIRAQAKAAGVSRRRAFSYLDSCPRTSARCSAWAGPFRWAALSGDPEDIFAADRAALDDSRTTRGCIAGFRWPSATCASRAARGSAGSAPRSGRGSACASTAWAGGAAGPVVIGRDHLDAGSGRRRIARPGDARRQRRDRRLADLERAAEHRLRRVVGERPWRRGGDRQLDPRRHGRRATAPPTPTRPERVLTNDPGTRDAARRRRPSGGRARAAHRPPAGAHAMSVGRPHAEARPVAGRAAYVLLHNTSGV
jgi:urocanate hydratase